MDAQVSVLIPAYNSEHLLPETLESILTQTLAPAEVIVVDDGSSDDTRGAVARFGERVRYHRVDNGGICRSRNIAASLASSPFLAFCDHDDLWRKDKLEQQMSLHLSNTQLEYSFTNFSFVVNGVWADHTKFQDAPTGFFWGDDADGKKTFEVQTPLYDHLLEFQPVWPSTVVLSKALFTRVGGFVEELGKNPSEDFEFTLRCTQTGPIGVVAEPVVGVRRHTSNYSGSSYKNTIGQLEILRYALEHHAISKATQQKVWEQIKLRRIEASYDAFRLKEFCTVRSLLQDVPASALDRKTLLKKWIAFAPRPIASLLHDALSR